MKNIFLIGLSIFLMGCETDDIQIDETIHYGTSFGECLGYCITETQIQNDEISVTAKSWGNDLEEKKSVNQISDETIRKILDGINADTFKGLPATIGCPDCADGGSEWLELLVDGKVKRVTFEYQQNIEGIAPAIVELRKLTETFYPEN